MYATAWSLVPPLVAIILALITKEVYSSLFIGIVVGGLFYANFSPKLTYLTIFTDITDGGMLAKLLTTIMVVNILRCFLRNLQEQR
jgi:tetracycline resistance efflux pump